MQHELVKDFLSGLQKSSDDLHHTLKKKALRIAILRGVLFLGAAYWFWYSFPSPWLLLLSFVFVVVFLLLMKWQAAIRAKIQFEKAFQKVLERDIENKAPQDLPWVDKELVEHPLARDLDVFGKFSLHSAIHRTYSDLSSQKLANSLIHYPQDEKEILTAQSVTQALSKKVEGLYHFFALSLLASFSVKEENALREWLKTPRFKVSKVLIWSFTGLFFITTTAGLLELLPMQIVMYVFTINLMLVYGRNKKISSLQGNLTKVHSSLERVSSQIALWQNELADEADKAQWAEPQQALKSLARIMARLDSRLNPLGAVIFNGMMLYDLHTMAALEKWRDDYSDKLMLWLDDLALREVSASKACYAIHHAGVYPELSNAAFEIQFRDLKHPLMRPEKAVPNSFSMDDKGKEVILTGSNMSGKSTFLRAVGSTLLLAHNGLPVSGSFFRFTPLQLHSSIRVNDSLEDEASYFYAELQRLTAIVQEAERQPRLFYLLDEILRGTNSADKQAGSRAVVMQLMKKGANGILATHDLSLTELEAQHPNHIINYAFESKIMDDKLSFDYTLRKGVCSQLNAMFLMKKMGIMD